MWSRHLSHLGRLAMLSSLIPLCHHHSKRSRPMWTWRSSWWGLFNSSTAYPNAASLAGDG